MVDHFLTISGPSEALLKEKSSKFFAYAYNVKNVEDVEKKLRLLKKRHLKARHFCYAFVLGIEKKNFRANDDGEPSGTAGRPIKGQIEKLGLTDILVVVVRYFGGTKLGTSGLIKAYKGSAASALEKANILEQFLFHTIGLTISYEVIGNVMEIINKTSYEIATISYEEIIKMTLNIRKSEVEQAVKLLKAKILQRSVNDIEDDTEVPGVAFQFNELQ